MVPAISGRCIEPLFIIIDFRLMLLPYIWLMLLPFAIILTDVVVTFEADVIALFLDVLWQMLIAMYIGRCYGQFCERC